MTREDAIKVLKQLKRFDDTICKSPKNICAVYMGIEALEQEPCEDAISRQAVLDAIHEADMTAYDEQSLIRDLMQAINELPSVTPQEPKTGHWKTMAYSNGGAIKRGNIIESELYGIHYECSLCHFTYVVPSESKEPKDKQMYCPSCGAKMVEPQESEEDK